MFHAETFSLARIDFLSTRARARACVCETRVAGPVRVARQKILDINGKFQHTTTECRDSGFISIHGPHLETRLVRSRWRFVTLAPFIGLYVLQRTKTSVIAQRVVAT